MSPPSAVLGVAFSRWSCPPARPRVREAVAARHPSARARSRLRSRARAPPRRGARRRRSGEPGRPSRCQGRRASAPAAVSRTRAAARPARPGARPAARGSGSGDGVMVSHPLFELSECAVEPRRDCGGADPEQACGLLAVELEHDAECDHLALARGEGAEPLLELRGQALAERARRVRAARAPPRAAPAAGVAPRRGTSRARPSGRWRAARRGRSRDGGRTCASGGAPSRTSRR